MSRTWPTAPTRQDTPGFAAFDVCVDVDGVVRWLGAPEWSQALTDTGLDIPLVPVLYEGPYDEALLLALASGKETVSGTGAHIREGIVVRSQQGARQRRGGEPDDRQDRVGGVRDAERGDRV